MHTTNYVDTLILPSEDCQAKVALVPSKAGTVAAMQYERLSDGYALDSDTLLVAVTGVRREVPEDEWAELRSEIFSKGQACLRASPLVKTYGWALHHDANSKVALVDPASERFQTLMEDTRIFKVRGMRSSRV